jgi:hypothetical protein
MFDKNGKINKELVKEILDNYKNSKDLFPSILIKTPAPEGTLCPSCKKETLIIHKMPLSGPYSGGIICSSCDHRDSVIGFLGKQMINVQPLPDGAAIIYSKDPEEE